MTEKDLLTFQEDIQSLDPIECDAKAIELLNFVEDNNLNLSDYKYLDFYASFNNLLESTGRLKEEFRDSYILNEDTEPIILTEATSLKQKREELTKFILDSIALVDRSGLNVKKYRDLYSSMSDAEFKKHMDEFFSDDNKNFYLEILPNKSEPSIKDIENLLKKLDIPKEEYVYYRDDGFKDDPIRTREKCTVGYVVVRRLQQILSKKNTYSLDIDNRDSKTGQVTGADKIARISDAELYGLTVFNADNAIKEFFGARADNMTSKTDMYSKISKYGYVYLDELNNDPNKNQTLNTINTYLLGAGIKSDLVENEADKAKEILTKQVLDAELQKMGQVKKEDTEILNEKYYGWNYKFIEEDTVDIYIALEKQDEYKGYIDYPLTEEFNGKYANTTLEGLEQFIKENKLQEEYSSYIKTTVKKSEIMQYDDASDGVILKLPFARDIEEAKKLFK